jgi:putative FmdB family regulatory protein
LPARPSDAIIMPIYEYRCNQCHRRFSHFFKSFATTESVGCSSCGSADVGRLISSVSVPKSDESRMENMADGSWLGDVGDVDQSDPRSMARWARRMGREMGEYMGPEFDEMVDRMEAGEMPDDMPGAMPGGDDSFGMPEW